MRHLDTNIVIAYLNQDPGVIKQLHARLPNVAISSLVLEELMYGVRASVRATQNLERIDQFLQLVSIADFDQACADACSNIRLALRQIGRPTGAVDTWIAAVAVANNAILVTHNVKHFKDIPNLIIEDWLA